MSKTSLIAISSLILLCFSSTLTGQKTEKSVDVNKESKSVIIVTKKNLPTVVDSLRKLPNDSIDLYISKADSVKKVIQSQGDKFTKAQKKNSDQTIVYVDKVIVKHDTVYIEKKSWFKKLFTSKNKKNGN